jgi:hypothetical protein
MAKGADAHRPPLLNPKTQKFEKVAGNISCFSYVPYVFMSPVAPLRPPDQVRFLQTEHDRN